MAKRDIDRGKLTPRYKNRLCVEIAMHQANIEIDRAKRNNERKVGIRAIVMEAYSKGGKDAALKAIQEANKRIGQEVYTEKMLDSWLADELTKRNRDDEDAR